jgi:sulfate-transporting ATPase
MGTGSLYVLVALGIVLVYRGSGVVNFAHGAIGMVGTFVWWELRDQNGAPFWIAAVAGVGFSAALGAITHLLVMRRLRSSSTLTRAIATLAVLAILQSLAALRWPGELQIVTPFMPSGVWTIFGVTLGRDRILIFGFVCVLTVVLYGVYRYTRFGLATTAVAENRRGAAALAVSPDLIAAVNWSVGAALAGIAGILLAPLTGLSIGGLTLIVIPALAAAVCGRLQSFPLTMVGGLAIGIAQAEVTNYWPNTPGLGNVVPLVIVTVVLWLRGTSIPGKGEIGARLPSIGTGRIRPLAILFACAVTLFFVWFQFEDLTWVDSTTTLITIAMIVLSVVVVSGYAGQLSLVQYGIAGLGALVAGRLVGDQGWPFEIALVVGALATIPLGLLVGLAGVRTRGVNLGIVTLSLAVALEAAVFNNVDLTGGVDGVQVGSQTFFGWDINAILYPKRYATVALGLLVVLGLMVANVRRGRVGRRLIAVRANERAAASLGISVVGAKLYAFALAGVIAAVGGIILSFRNPGINFTQFDTFRSLAMVQDAVVGGLGWIPGAPLGAGLEPGTPGAKAFEFILGDDNKYIYLIGGVLLLVTILHARDGLAALQAHLGRALLRVGRLGRPDKPLARPHVASEVRSHAVASKTLELRDVTVRFGGIVAVDGLSIEVQPGEIVGLIGPNGAGKTTAIDAITGFNRPSGAILLDGARIDGWGREQRARAGLGRSFQSLELFDDMTVLENIQAASERRDGAAYVTNLVHPGKAELTSAAVAAIREFDLERDLDLLPTELPYGRRRLVGIARSVAAEPSVLLLDEPAAGLDERETHELGELIVRLATQWGMGILLIEHDVALVMRVCDRICALNFGKTIASGTRDEVRNDPAVVEAYLGTPASQEQDALPVPGELGTDPVEVNQP